MRGKNACCVALYDWKNGADVANWYAYCERLFKRAGKEIGVAAVDASGFSGKPMAFKKVKKTFKDPAILNRCHTIQLLAMEHRNYHSLVFGWRVEMSMIKSPAPLLFFGFDESIGMCGEELVRGIFKECLKWSHPAYGIAYSRPFEKGPNIYALGMIAGLGYSPEEEAESGAISDWMHELGADRRHLKGMLRDVYPWNFLSDVHLNHSCGTGHNLRNWIESSKGRGVIEPLGRHRYCWTVPEQHVPSVRTELHQHGLLIARPF